MFRLVFGGPMPDLPDFEPDRVLGDEALHDARERVRRGDWQAARKVIEDAGVDWETRGRRIGVLSDAAAADDRWLYAWLQADPNDPAAVLIQAAMLNQRAGEARGSASAAHTTAEQFQNFRALSHAAGQVGQRAMALAGPYDPLPWVEIMSTMFADHDARKHSFDAVLAEGRRRDPVNFDLHWSAISLRCEKWYGSHEQMFAMAREVAAAAPPGASSVLFPLFAHFEYALREFAWDTHSARSLRASRKYFRRPEVQRELDHWIAKWRAGRPNVARISTCLQWLALFYTLTGRKRAAKAVFDQLGGAVNATNEWGYFWGGSELGYLKAWMWANGV